MSESEKDWADALRCLDIERAELISVSSHDPFRRVYKLENTIYKIALTDREISATRRANTLEQEFEILQSCKRIGGIQQTIDYKSIKSISCLLNHYVEGQTLEKYEPGFLVFVYLIMQLAILVVRLAIRGISQNDLLENNILIGPGYRITLLDFDQATRESGINSFLRGMFGIGHDGHTGVAYGSLLMLTKNYAIKYFPDWLQKIVRIPFRVVRTIYRYYKNYKEHKLPVLSNDANEDTKKLLSAWVIAQKSHASSPGKTRAYYSLVYDGYHFPGERPWEERWQVLKGVTDYSGRKILELGCNMGLLSCFLVREANASKSFAVDMDSEILRAANKVAEAFNVDATFKQVNFDSAEPWEQDLIDYSPDIVFALNVFNWVKDKERFLKFLGNFEQLVYEGHDSFEVESARLRSVGFTSVEKITSTERGRDVIYCSRGV